MSDAVAAYAIGTKVSCLVSGGVDSGVVSTLAAKKCPRVRLASVDLGGSNEFTHADALAASLSLHCEKIYVPKSDLLHGFGLVVKHAEHWFSTYLEYLVPFYLALSNLDRPDDVVLSGYGADILLGGFAAETATPDDIAKLVQSEFATATWANERSQTLGGSLGIEIANPFFDNRVVSTCLRIDPNLKHKDGINKYILRKAFLGILEPHIAWRPKIGIHQSTNYQTFLTSYIAGCAELDQTLITRAVKDQFAYHVWRQIFILGREPSDIDYRKIARAVQLGSNK